MRRILSCLLLAVVAGAQLPNERPTCVGGPLHVRVVSTLGTVAGRLRLTLTNPASAQKIEQGLDGNNKDASAVVTLTELPCGNYSVDAWSPLLMTAGKRVEVSITAGERWLTLAYPFGKPVDHYGAPPSVDLVGTVRRAGGVPRDAWVKLVGVYTDDSREVQVDVHGGFSFRRLAEGSYVAILTSSHAEPMVRTARLTAGINRIEFSIP